MYGSTGHPLHETISAAVAAGFTNIGIDVWSIRAYLSEGGSVPRLADELRAHALTCTDLVGLVVGRNPARTCADAQQLAELADRLDADLVLLAFDAAVPDWRSPSVLRAVREAADILAARGARVAVEYIPYTSLATVADARELCALLGGEQAAICVDAFHTLVAGELDQVRSLSAAEIAMVQLDDVERRHLVDVPDASRNHRLLPGAGDLPIEEFVDTLRQIGFTGVVSAEVLSSAVRRGASAPFAIECHDALHRAWAQ